jgi:rubrerythrin
MFAGHYNYLARRTASPFFNERLVKLENSLEKRLLLAIAEDDDKAFQRLSRLLDARNRGIGCSPRKPYSNNGK